MQDLKLLADIMTDFWEFQKTWINTRDWSGLNQASNALHEKYHNGYLDQLILVCADDIERRAGASRTDRKEMLMKLVERLCRKDR